MKKYLIYALGLVLVAAASLLAFDAICVVLVKQSQGTSMYKMYRLFVNHPADELPIFGSSRAASNYVPSLISPKAFCYGIDGSGMNETLFLVENYLKQNPTGGPIIINLDPWGFPKSHEGGFVADYTLSPVLPRTQCNVLGVRMIGKLRELVASWLNQRMAKTKRIDNGSILQLINRTEDEWEYITSKINVWQFYVDDEWRERLKRVYKITDRKLVWVIGPCVRDFVDKCENRMELDAFVHEISKWENTVVIDLLMMESPMTVCHDERHLNARGAEIFTKKMLESFNP